MEGKREYFQNIRNDFLVIPGNSEEAKRSKFACGIFKVEWTGKIALGLSAKVYAVFSESHEMLKASCRSVPHMCAAKLTCSDFYSVLHEHKPIEVTYQTFNYICGQMLSEKMKKNAITPYYIKRAVLSDLSTKTLDL